MMEIFEQGNAQIADNNTLDLATTLQDTFGHAQFRPLQQEIIQCLLKGNDTLVIMPTGGGKSLCFQLPALHLPHTTLVISPLIALMQNQVDALQASGIAATCINSSLEPAEASERERAAIRGDYKLVYLSPERLMSSAGYRLLTKMPVNLIAIDEAHCISEWGHDFRPEYRMLGDLRIQHPDRFAKTPIVALTATATPRVAEDIQRQLHLINPQIFHTSFERPNLRYEIRPKHEMMKQVLEYLEQNQDHEGIIYCQSRARCEQIAEQLQRRGISALPYHAGLENNVRKQNQHDFIYGSARIIVATIAFGMGIDKPDVRFVFHADLPRHIEGYYQETGRAGRDGMIADCILFYSAADRTKVEYFIEQKEDPEQRDHAYWQLNKMIRYAHTTDCRCIPLLDYFGEEHSGDCGHCDNCLNPPKLIEATEDARKLLSAIARTDQRYGLSHIIDILRGSNAQKIIDRNHHNLSVHGIGRDKPKSHWLNVAETLLRDGHLGMTIDEFRTTHLTESSPSILRGELPITVAISRAISTREDITVKRTANEPTRPVDASLFQALRELRKQLAQEKGVPPYVIFGDISLKHMAADYPINDFAFLQIPGVGQTKLQRYGEAFMDIIKQFAPQAASCD
ncbi:ATP-dependent DNA helicase RecQ [Poriferisphaera corsica]|uniref:DNA helicase RecQ n=1 Tax=Poriferisphaera corsica TaxID=2528020 RepID=A0A517YTT2_9BACT|nr:DNA helicase RecQ [Poriferisphaera corsica]QDU33636.1 ATP-dependent DNA helicase RecQ [Poriferisphaera corsica]